MNADNILFDILALLTAAVIAIPLFHRLGFGSVLGYLAAGAVLGPWGLKIIVKVSEIRDFAEFGVVFLLFLIGIEMKPARLWVMRRWVFGLGLLQLMITGIILTGIALYLELPIASAIISGFGLALSSTAFGLQILAEKNELSSVTGRTAFSILLLQDLAVVPLLALVSLLAEGIILEISLGAAIWDAVLAIGCVVISGRYLLNPILDRIAASRNSEVFVAAAVLLVLGVARLMEIVGLSMALGAFLAGLMLAESRYRHQIEADIQPFRGILLGLFFMSVGMSIDLGLLYRELGLILGLFVALMLIKGCVLWGLCRISGLNTSNTLRISVLLSQSGEFGFVLFGFAMISGVFIQSWFQILTLVIALSMVATPFVVKFGDWWVRRSKHVLDDSVGKLEIPGEKNGYVILAGFGRVGQRIASLMHGAHIPYIVLDSNQHLVTEGRIKGYPVFFGDASRLEVLKAAGAEQAKMLVVSIDNAEKSDQLVKLVRLHYPLLPIHVRAKDRKHCETLMLNGANSVVSETLEASLRLGELVLIGNGYNRVQTTRLLEDCRQGYYGKLKMDTRIGPDKKIKTDQNSC